MSTSVELGLDGTPLRTAFTNGLAAAVASCAEMSHGRLLVSTSEIAETTPAGVIESAGGPDLPVVAVCVGFSGGLSGFGVLLLRPAGARELAGLVVGELDRDADGGSSSVGPHGLTDLERAALEEVGNVAVSAVLIAVGDTLGQAIYPTVPLFLYDMAGSILDGIVSDTAGADNGIVSARAEFAQAGGEAAGMLLIIPHAP